MAIKRRFAFHVDKLISDAQIRSVIDSYPKVLASYPTGWYQKTNDIVQIEIYLEDTSQENIADIESRIKTLLLRVTARPVIPATELGPVPEGYSVPTPETSSGSFLGNVFGNIFAGSFATVGIVILLGLIIGVVLIFRSK